MTITLPLRHKDDPLVRPDYDYQGAEILTVNGGKSGGYVGMSEYPYGMQIFCTHPCNQLEFHMQRWGSSGFSAILTLVRRLTGKAEENEIQVRKFGDTDALTLSFSGEKDAIPLISTEQRGTHLKIAPKGKLYLDGEQVLVKGEPLEDFISRVVRTNV